MQFLCLYESTEQRIDFLMFTIRMIAVMYQPPRKKFNILCKELIAMNIL